MKRGNDRLVAITVAAIALVLAATAGRSYLMPSPQAADTAGAAVTADRFAEGSWHGAAGAGGALRFAPGVAAADRRLVEAALARADPRARALVESLAPAIEITIGRPASGAAGTTAQPAAGRFVVTLDLGLVYRELGERGTDRLILHEFGHVVDFALTPPELDRRLDTMLPQAYGCRDGVTGACANARERFAESFSKWATGDIGAQAGAVLGYQVPPPTSLEQWGSDLSAGVASRRR